jgi:hypothetical protein
MGALGATDQSRVSPESLSIRNPYNQQVLTRKNFRQMDPALPKRLYAIVESIQRARAAQLDQLDHARYRARP